MRGTDDDDADGVFDCDGGGDDFSGDDDADAVADK